MFRLALKMLLGDRAKYAMLGWPGTPLYVGQQVDVFIQRPASQTAQTGEPR